MNLWEECQGSDHIMPISGLAYRLVESQEQVATLEWAESLDEQMILEELLEDTKPPYPEASHHLHYLLKTPFRYPPLEWGSRFGTVVEPSLFYGGCSEGACLAESAYYRFVYWDSMEAPPPRPQLRSEHTLFSVRYRVAKGVRLQLPPFSIHKELVHPSSYQATQALGSAMRGAEVEGFEYRSARDPQRGTCIALFTPTGLAENKPSYTEQILCQLQETTLSFKLLGSNQIWTFKRSIFEVDGKLPLPA